MNEPTVWLQQHASWPAVYDFFSDIGGPIGWWVLLQIVILFVGTRRGLRLAWFVGVAALSNTLLKWLWAEPRPYWVSDSISATRATPGFGMPSGHAQGAMALWFGLWLALARQSRSVVLFITALTFVVFTALSRVYYGVHSVPQVVVGLALGLGLTWALWAVLPRLESWLRASTLPFRVAFAALCLGVAFAVSWLVLQFRADFVAPVEWQARFDATQARVGLMGELGDMGLVNGSSLVLVALLAGFAVLALVSSETGHRLARRLGARVSCLLFAVAVNLAVILFLRTLDSGFAVVVWLVLQPVVALWLPLRLFGELDQEPASL